MTQPLYAIPGTPAAPPAATAPTEGAPARTVAEVLRESQVESVLDELDRDLVGLAPVKQRIRDIAALLVIDKVDLVLIMSVNPGFGGQGFIASALRKIEQARRIIDASGRDIALEVDGGIKAANIRAVADAGADTFVAGSAIFGRPDYSAVMAAMRIALAAQPAIKRAA